MSAGWWQMTIVCALGDTDAVAATVVSVTGFGVAEPRPGVITAVASSDVDAERLAAELVRRFPGLTAQVESVDPVDWSVRWRDGITSHRFGRLLVTPSWLPVTAAADTAVVTIDPESAFGSGEHGSTRAALRLLERHLTVGDRVLDFGSGSGILAIAAVALGARSAIGIEVDAEAHPIAEANAVRNGVSDRAAFLVGDVAAIGVLAGPADLVCSNILRSVNMLLLPTIHDALRPGGVAIFSGMEVPERELFLPVLEAAGWALVDEVVDGDWWAPVARRSA
jgi:ribosomal protein L11 methyltransferase